MIKTLKVRFYPDKEQIILLEKHPRSCRFVYNHFYEVRIKYHAEHRKYGKNRLTGFDTMWMLIPSTKLICCKSVETVKFSPGFVNINGLYSQICVILYIYCTIIGLMLWKAIRPHYRQEYHQAFQFRCRVWIIPPVKFS